MTLSVGQVLENRYRVVSLLGQGGMGAVYRAWDLTLRVPVALKENLDLSPVSQQQFEREALLLAQLNHPNLPRVTNHFVVPGLGQYLVMEFIEGQDLQQWLDQRGRLTEAEAVPIVGQVASALAYLHSRPEPVIHRDIKPANIKITPDNRAVLVDFGIAKQYTPDGHTTRGAQAVTPGFSPPEQYGLGITDARSDIYALGATLYALLTGQTPTESVSRLAGSTLPYPAELTPPVGRAIMRAMEMEPANRFQAAPQFATALTTPLGPEKRGRSPLLWPALAAVLLLVLVGGFFLLRPLFDGDGGQTQQETTTADATPDAGHGRRGRADRGRAHHPLLPHRPDLADPRRCLPRGLRRVAPSHPERAPFSVAFDSGRRRAASTPEGPFSPAAVRIGSRATTALETPVAVWHDRHERATGRAGSDHA